MSLVFLSRGLFGPEVTLDAAGIRRKKLVIPWTAIDHYRYEWHQPSRPGDILVVGTERRLLRLAPHAERFAEVRAFFVAHAHPALGAAPSFAPFAFDDDGLVCGDRRVAARDIEHVGIGPIDGLVAVVIRHRDSSAWARYDVLQIANFWLWLEHLRARNIAIVEDTANPRGALPVARLVKRP